MREIWEGTVTGLPGELFLRQERIPKNREEDLATTPHTPPRDRLVSPGAYTKRIEKIKTNQFTRRALLPGGEVFGETYQGSRLGESVRGRS